MYARPRTSVKGAGRAWLRRIMRAGQVTSGARITHADRTRGIA